MAKEKDVLMDHEYDGIRELDNDLPPWWLWLFYITIIFSGVYLFYFHVFASGDLMIAEYENELNSVVQLVKTEKATSVYETLTDQASLDKGKAVFMKNCVSCHGQLGEGLIGPNFTDDYWIYGTGINNIINTINSGVPAKGMITWRGILKDDEIIQVGSYILTLHGTNPPNPKAPQGELVQYPLQD